MVGGTDRDGGGNFHSSGKERPNKGTMYRGVGEGVSFFPLYKKEKETSFLNENTCRLPLI